MDIEVNPIRLKKHTKIGELDAESDKALLSDCFIESDEYISAKDCANPKSIALGRVGSGKSALILKLKEDCEKSVYLDPQTLSFHYIENSTILQFVEQLDVNLNTFFKLLWRHVLVVELLKCRFKITDSLKQHTIFDTLAKKFSSNEKKKKALSYLQEWGEKFWEETELRVKEVTRKLENQLGGALSLDFSEIKGEANAKRVISEEQKNELSQRAKRIVNDAQIRKLGEVLELLADEDLLGDPQKKFYVLIDGLDDNWAGTDTRCRLIRALIEEIKTFRQLDSVKIVVALRRDLLALVYDKTRDSGFQEEKYEALLLELNWTESSLKSLVNKRVTAVFERQYSRQRITFDDLFPTPKSSGGGVTPFDYMIQRTLRRPRDIIQFVNETFKIASDKSKISINDIRKAENVYSEKRIKSLQEEWADIYPSLDITVEILRGAPSQLNPEYIKKYKLEDTIRKLWEGNPTDPCVRDALKLGDSTFNATRDDILRTIIQTLYQVGILGIKTDSNDAMCWAWKDQPKISIGEASRCNRIKIHRMVWQALNVIPDSNISLLQDSYP